MIADEFNRLDITLSTSYLSDPFGRLEASITLSLTDESDNIGYGLSECRQCFVWQYQSVGESEWNSFDVEGNGDISMSILKLNSEYTSTLVVQSIRRLNAGYCVDDDAILDHPFQEGMHYQIRMKFESDSFTEISGEKNLSTNSLPSGGSCVIQSIENLLPLEPYNLFCDFWETENETDLEYNALIEDVMMSTDGFVDDARNLTGMAPAGNTSITVLVKMQNEYNAITCYEFTAAFKSVDDANANQSVNDTLLVIDSITDSTSLGSDPDAAVSIHSVVENLYQSNSISRSKAVQIVDDMVVNILQTWTDITSSNESLSNITGNAIITELATLSSITTNENIVDVESTMLLVDEYLPTVFDAIDLFIDIESENSNTSSMVVQDALYSIGGQLQQLICNLEAIISNLTEEPIDSVNSWSESLVDYATLAASTALAQSEIEETFSFQLREYDNDGTVRNSKVVNAVKFVAGDNVNPVPLCGSSEQNMELPRTFMMDQQGTFDCAFMASTRNNFVPNGDQNERRTAISDNTITVNIYGEGSRRRRRRLAEAVEYDSNECYPYSITINVANLSLDHEFEWNELSPFPSCEFWNTYDSYWATDGCFVYDTTNDSVICGCTHLTTFSVSAGSVFLESTLSAELEWNNLTITTESEWREFTIQNFIAYPTASVFLLLLLFVVVLLCIINPRASKVDTPSILSIEESAFKSVRDEKLWKDTLGKEIAALSAIPNHVDLVC